MTAWEFERVDAEELFEGWRVWAGHLGSSSPEPLTVERREGELVLVTESGFAYPVSMVEHMVLYRAHVPLPSAPGLYVTEDPDLEVIELVKDSGWRATDTEGRQLEVAEVRELGELVHHVRSDLAAQTLIQAMDEMKVAAMAGIRDAWAQLDAREVQGRRRALAEVNALLRSRWWLLPVRVVFGRRFGAELLETGEGR